ncbi:MAG: hypothetical protein U0798_20560 [Gemmataceae bacterium]
MSATATLNPATETPMPRVALEKIEATGGPNGSTPSAEPTLGFFQQNLPANLILFSFVFLTIPFALCQLFLNHPLVFWTYIWLFGTTHFIVTFVVYFQKRNLKYFLSSPKNIAIYFVVPAVLFIGFDMLHAFRIGALYPTFALYFWGAVRLFDFNHLNRQTFGVYQMFKVRAGVRTTKDLKWCENGYFNSLSALMFVTFLSGGATPFLLPGGWFQTTFEIQGLIEPKLPVLTLQFLACAALASTFGFLIASLVKFKKASVNAGNPDAITPALLYLLFQSLGAFMAAIYLPLYAAALAIHYVEYHVLMVPRTLNVPLDETSRLDRAFGRVRSSRIVFYSIVLFISLIATAMSYAGMGMMGRNPETLTLPFNYLVLISMFDGLFVFHYFVEMFIWRFSDPFYRQTLSNLYFAPKS